MQASSPAVYLPPRICERCGHDNARDRRFCGDCGAQIVRMCRRCQFANELSDKFCGGCGCLTRKPAPNESTSHLRAVDGKPRKAASKPRPKPKAPPAPAASPAEAAFGAPLASELMALNKPNSPKPVEDDPNQELAQDEIDALFS